MDAEINYPLVCTYPRGFYDCIGSTGPGKSTFVSKFSEVDMAIGTGLESRTNCDQASTYFNKSVGEAISFLDTTGFKQALPDNWRTVNKSRVSLFLVTRYKAKIPLLGILYLHPVADEPTNKA
ncbi:hypothetical protein V8B97DRAFT_309303, partial [Scleroderma yunnanense]